MTEIDALGAWVPTETNEIKNSELWSLDATLTDYILPRIKAFRKMQRHGHPVLGKDIVLEKNIKPDSDTYSADTDERRFAHVDERKEAEWENILFDIEKGFEAHKKMIDDIAIQSLAEMTAAEETLQKGLQLFAEHYNYLWDCPDNDANYSS